MDLSGQLIAGTGQYEVKEWNIVSGNQLSGWDFTSGWITNGSTVVDANTFTTPDNVGRGVRKVILTVGHKYKCKIAGTFIGTGQFAVRSFTLTDLYFTDITGSFDSTFEFTAKSTDFYLELESSSGGGQVDITTMELTEIPPLPTLDKGTKFLECTSAGTCAFASTQSYGEWEFDLYKGADGNTLNVAFVSSTIQNRNGYQIQLNSSQRVLLGHVNSAGTITQISYSAPNYIIVGTWYRIKVTRTLDGEFYYYIKGGVFGTNDWTLVDVSGGAGSNPITNTLYTESQYFVLDLDIGDRIANIVTRKAVHQ